MKIAVLSMLVVLLAVPAWAQTDGPTYTGAKSAKRTAAPAHSTEVANETPGPVKEDTGIRFRGQPLAASQVWPTMSDDVPRPYVPAPGYYYPNAYDYGGYGYYYNPVPQMRDFRKFGVENTYGAFKIDGNLPGGGIRSVKVCVDGKFRDEASNIRGWTDPSAGLTAGDHVIEMRDLARRRAFKEQVHVEPKAVTETFGGNRFKINLYLNRIEAEDSYPITGSCGQ